jgi:hypothetical protein
MIIDRFTFNGWRKHERNTNLYILTIPTYLYLGIDSSHYLVQCQKYTWARFNPRKEKPNYSNPEKAAETLA